MVNKPLGTKEEFADVVRRAKAGDRTTLPTLREWMTLPGMVELWEGDGYDVDVPGIVPKLMGTPGSVRSSAPKLGDDTDDILREIGLSESRIAELRDKGAIA